MFIGLPQSLLAKNCLLMPGFYVLLFAWCLFQRRLICGYTINMTKTSERRKERAGRIRRYLFHILICFSGREVDSEALNSNL